MKELNYPFYADFIIKKKKSLKRELLNSGSTFIEKRIAVLGGSTTHDIVTILDLFLLNQGIKCEFYECEYGRYYEDVMFDNDELKSFAPDIIYFHTSYRNLTQVPDITWSKEDVDSALDAEFNKFTELWQKASSKYGCPIIQNNFELPYYRVLGNSDASFYQGTVRYVNRFNERLADYADTHDNFFIQDINYLSSCYGLDKWGEPKYWHMYKYSLSIDAIPYLSFNLSNIIKSIFGKNKKAFALDLDNTLWGGIIGDDGVENIEIGKETPVGEIYGEFQSYLKAHKNIGVILNIISKNDHENAIEGLEHPDSVLKPADFISIKANWEPKSDNLIETAKELNLLPESFVFVDDNPAERDIVLSQINGIVAPEIDSVSDYIKILDRAGYFEVTNFSADDIRRNEMYAENEKRLAYEKTFTDYGLYLDSLEMTAEIAPFSAVYLDRIAQLTNKSNQFNLTTKRYTRAEIEEAAEASDYIDLYGKLCDKFGDNGVVSVVIGHIKGDVLDIDLWIMSCRVLKRDMEYAMMDELVKKASEKGIKRINGYYYKTAKNNMVKDFYKDMGFEKINESENGDSMWTFSLENEYNKRNIHIKIKK